MTTTELHPDVDLALEALLETVAESERAVTWHPGWSRGTPVPGVEHLMVLMSVVPLHDFGGLCLGGDDTSRWAQAKFLPEGWIVEVRDPAVRDWPERVYRGTSGSYIRSVVPEAGCPEEHFTTSAAVQVMWAWLQGGLPAGCATADPVD